MTLSILLKRATSGTRAGLAVAVVLALGSRLAVIATAVAVGEGGVTRAAIVAGVVTTLCLAGQRLVLLLTRARCERDLQRAVVDALLESDVIDVARERTQRVVFEGTYHAVPVVAASLPALVSDAVAAIVIVPLLIATFPERILATGALALVAIVLAVLVARRLAQRGEARANAAYEEVADALLLAVEGRLEIVARGGERAFEERFATLTDRYVRAADRVGVVSAWLGRAPLVVGAAAVAAIALVDVSSREQLSAALFTRALVLAACLPPLFGAVVGVQAVARNLALSGPLAQLLVGARRREVGTTKDLPSLPATFEVDQVSFRYADGLPLVLDGVSFTWTAQEPLLLLGENGSGKSTLLKLFIGLRRPTAGTIRIGGRDLSSIDLRALRRSFVYLPQRPYLGEAYGTVRAAVRIALPEVSDDAIFGVLERVGLLGVVRAHGGLEATIGTLSAGQRQRLALARVLLQRAAVVILDEPDANLDRDGIALVASLVKEMSAEGRMVALAAHTPDLAALSTQPVVLRAS
jgi:ABC-type bacteriocin/lantibiotic exporter with double-glycine peptidase domain